MSARLDALRAAMAREGIDLVALGPGAHLRWLTGLHPHADERPLLMCVSPTHAGLLMPALEAQSARRGTELPFSEWSDDDGPERALAGLLRDCGADAARSIALDETMRADFAGLVQDALPGAARQFCGSTVGRLRMRKDEAEREALRRNAAVADAAMEDARAAMRPGMTERQLAAVIREGFASRGARPLFNIVGAGPNGAFPHHQTGDAVLKEGDAVVMDIGGAMEGYSSDITRMAVIGEPPEGYAEIHAIVERAVQAALAAARPGVPAREVDRAARGVIEAAGYGERFVHRLGHGMGVEIHEPPYLTASSETVLEEGMVFSIEPGIYLPGRFGIRLEEIVILGGDGPEILSRLARDVHVARA